MPLLVLFCCEIPRGKYMSAVQHGVAAKRLFVRYMVTGEDINCGPVTEERLLTNKTLTRSSFIEIPRINIAIIGNVNSVAQEQKREGGQHLSKTYSQSSWSSFRKYL